VRDELHLDYLYCLTVADICATNDHLWNDWKDSLLWDLFQSARRVLRRGVDGHLATSDLVHECREEARTELIAAGYTEGQFVDLWEALSDDYFVRTRPEDVAWHTRTVLEHGEGELPLVAVRTAGRGTEVFIYDVDKEYLFAATTTSLERLGLTVLDARIFTDSNGKTFDSYIVLEANGDPIVGEARASEIRRTLTRRLAEPAKAAYPQHRLPRRQLRNFPIATRITFEHDEKHGRTIMDVVSADRPGLLSRIGWALVGCNATVHNAKIATLGERAEDIFFVADRDGGPLGDAQSEAIRANIMRALEPARKRGSVEPEPSGGPGITGAPSPDAPWAGGA
jgi:[protein-PII] uridylyltransferase